jgi:large repetitive protein
MKARLMSVLTVFFLFTFINAVSQTDPPKVVITDQNGSSETIDIDCNYSFVPPKKIRLTATYPDLKTTTDYTVDPISYGITGNLSDGTQIVYTTDDSWSSSIPLGFSFCFYNNRYTTVNISENGVVRFGYNSSIPENASSSVTAPIPSPGITKNAIFGGFQDMTVTNSFGCPAPFTTCGKITYLTTGVAPFRKFIVNFDGVNHYRCSGTDTKKSFLQVILYETSNIIDVNIQDKPATCAGAIASSSGGRSLLGINNIDGTSGKTPPNRNTGIWSANQESWRFSPSGSSVTTLRWFNASNNFIGSINPIEVTPNTNTFYKAVVRYATCDATQIEDTFTVNFKNDYPVAPNVTRKYCGTLVTVDLDAQVADAANLPNTTITFYDTQSKADAGVAGTEITNPTNFTPNQSVQDVYYRETVGTGLGSCYSTGILRLELYSIPQINDQDFSVCDPNNDGTETISLSGITTSLVGYQGNMNVTYYLTQADANAKNGAIASKLVNSNTEPLGTEVYIRVTNNSNASCYTVSKITLKLKPKLVLAPFATFCITDINFDRTATYDLNLIQPTVTQGTGAGVSYTYSNSPTGTPITNTNNFPVQIPVGQTIKTIYVTANNDPINCKSDPIPVEITFCKADGDDGDGGDPSGNGGFGGASECVEVGDSQVKTFDLNAIFNTAIAPIIARPLGFYTTRLAAQTEQILFQIPLADVANYFPVLPVLPEIVARIFVRYTDANGIVGIKEIIIPIIFKQEGVVTEIDICDNPGDGLPVGEEKIDLTPYIQKLKTENPNFDVYVYASLLDYDNDIRIPDADILSYTINGPSTVVYVKVTKYGCDSPFDYKFNLKTYTLNPVIDIKLCDIGGDNTEAYTDLPKLVTDFIKTSTSVLTVHSTLNGAFNNSTSDLISNTNNSILVPQTPKIWIRITEPEPTEITDPKICPIIQEYDFGFKNTVDLIAPFTPFEICDTDGDKKVTLTGFTQFIENNIIVGTDGVPIKKLYYTVNDAENKEPTAEILANWDLFEYDQTGFLGSTPTLGLLLQNPTTGCERIVPVDIRMLSFPLSANEQVAACDIQNNGEEEIPAMSFFNSQIISGSYTFKYFLNQTDALAGTPEIPANYLVRNNQVVAVKISNGSISDCFAIKDITIKLNPTPEVNPTQPEVCDDLFDGKEVKAINAYESQLISGNVNDFEFKYFELEFQANDATNTNFYSNAQISSFNVQWTGTNALSNAIYVRVTNKITKCFSVVALQLKRQNEIVAINIEKFGCDISTNNDLQAKYDLEAIVPEMIAVPSNYTILYFTRKVDAENFSLTTSTILDINNYTIFSTAADFVYVRFTDKTTGCSTVKRIELKIYNLPKLENGFFAVCDDDLDAVYKINLNSLKEEVVQDPVPFAFRFFTSDPTLNPGAQPETNITDFEIPLADFPKIIYVEGRNIATDCTKIKTVTLTKKPDVLLNTNNTSLLKCDPDNDKKALFDLTEAQTAITSQTGINFQYFLTKEEMQNVTSPLNAAEITAFENTSNPQTIYVRLSAPASNCDSFATIRLDAFYENYVLPDEITLCDNNADGTEDINLENTVRSYLTSIIPTSIDLEFYTSDPTITPAVALTNTQPYTFTDFTTDIYVKITNISTDCSIVKKVNFVKRPNIVLLPVTKNVCDFDRNTTEEIVLNNFAQDLVQSTSATPRSVKAFETQLGANTLIAGEEISMTNYTQTTSTKKYWLRYEDEYGCYSVSSLDINIIPLPDPKTDPAILYACDVIATGDLKEIFDLSTNENYILNGATNSLVTYHTTKIEAENGDSPLAVADYKSYESTTASAWIRVTHNPVSDVTNCAVVIEQKLNVIPLPENIPLILDELVQCDNTGTPENNSEPFDLTTNIQAIATANPSYTISYHTAKTDAENNLGSITSPTNYESTTSATNLTQSVFVRISSEAAPSIVTCATILEQKLRIIALPNLADTLPELVQCDNTGATANNSEPFDLTTNIQAIATANSSYTITYHTTKTDAENNLGSITSPTNYESVTSATNLTQSIFVRIASEAAPSIVTCATILEQKLRIIALPNIADNLTELVQCDNTGTPENNSEPFDLTTNIQAIATANPSYTISYHTTKTDAENNLGSITSPTNYESVTSATNLTQSIFVRIASEAAPSIVICATILEQKLRIIALPNIADNLTELVQCDNTGTPENNSEPFDLTTNIQAIATANPSYTITYHTTKTDAENNLGSITSPTNYESATSATNLTQSVFVRIASEAAPSIVTCATVLEQKLKVNPLPKVGVISDYYSCINPNSNEATYILSTKNKEALEGKNENEYTVSYHLSENEAKLATNSLPDSYNSISKIIWVSVKQNSTGCINTGELKLITEKLTTATKPSEAETTQCDEDEKNDGFTKFNISSYTPIILGTQTESGYEINYYASKTDFDNNVTIQNLTEYTNIANPQTIYVNVINNATQKKCNASTTFDLKVNLLPEPKIKDGGVCYDQISNANLSSFVLDTELNEDYTFEWFLGSNTTPIPNETQSKLEVKEAGDYVVVATNKTTKCVSKPAIATVTKSEPAIVTVKVEYSFNENIKIIVTPTGLGDYNYQLDGSNFQESKTFENVTAGTHTITVNDKNGCEPRTQEIVVLDYDKFFTPNGDGINEKWNIRGIKGQPNAKVYILDRYGKLIGKIQTDSDGWDGTYGGSTLPSDDYWFTIDYVENGEEKTFKSHFTLKR